MKKLILISALVMTIACAGVVSADAKAPFRWTNRDQLTMMTQWSNFGKRQGYRYPYLYADCLLKAAQKMYRSYDRYLSDPTDKFTRLPAFTRCLVNYTESIYDSYYSSYP